MMRLMVEKSSTMRIFMFLSKADLRFVMPDRSTLAMSSTGAGKCLISFLAPRLHARLETHHGLAVDLADARFGHSSAGLISSKLTTR